MKSQRAPRSCARDVDQRGHNAEYEASPSASRRRSALATWQSPHTPETSDRSSTLSGRLHSESVSRRIGVTSQDVRHAVSGSFHLRPIGLEITLPRAARAASGPERLLSLTACANVLHVRTPERGADLRRPSSAARASRPAISSASSCYLRSASARATGASTARIRTRTVVLDLSGTTVTEDANADAPWVFADGAELLFLPHTLDRISRRSPAQRSRQGGGPARAKRRRTCCSEKKSAGGVTPPATRANPSIASWLPCTASSTRSSSGGRG